MVVVEVDAGAEVVVVELDVVVDDDPGLVGEVVEVGPGVVLDEAGGVVIAPGESMGTMNLPGGISAGFGFGKSTTGWPARAWLIYECQILVG